MPEEKSQIDPYETLKAAVIEVVLEDIKAKGAIFREIYRQLSREAESVGKSSFT